MNRKLLPIATLISFITFSCTKEYNREQQVTASESKTSSNGAKPPTGGATYTTYLIKKGDHYCSPRPLKSVSVTEMKFYAKLNESAIYQTVDPVNQFDVNKLWGFSEGIDNQYNSARIGWGYSDGAIRLYGYVYSKGVRYFQQITTVLPNQEVYCSIKISGNTYILSANGVSVTLPRGSTSRKASGYQQYPYFGGDEVAPQDITILIKPV
jgi:hypothetical protein